jgi:transposase
MERSNGKSSATAEESQSAPGPEVLEKATRRQFTAKYKRRILDQIDGMASGDVAAFLRREGLYWSNVCTWRKQREKGALAGLEPRQKGPGAKPASEPLTRRVAQLERENTRLAKQLREARLILDVQKKVLSLCEQIGDGDEPSSRS